MKERLRAQAQQAHGAIQKINICNIPVSLSDGISGSGPRAVQQAGANTGLHGCGREAGCDHFIGDNERFGYALAATHRCRAYAVHVMSSVYAWSMQSGAIVVGLHERPLSCFTPTR